MPAEISAIIPTRNRADVLADCLASLEGQTLPADDFEVIVVDNGSSDDTPAVIDKFSSRLPLVSTRVEEPGLHRGRHRGLRLARADALVFADDDIVAVPTWLAAMQAGLTSERVAMVGGNNHPHFESDPPAWLQALWQRPVTNGHALGPLSILDFGTGRFEIDPGCVWGCNFGIRRDVLQAAGGFHPDSFPPGQVMLRGDGETHVSDYVRRSDKMALFDAEASVFHRVSDSRMTVGYFRRRFFNQGVSDSYRQIRERGRVEPFIGIKTLSRRLEIAVKRRFGHERHRDEASIMMDCRAAYVDGYRAHGRAVARDPELLAWVLKEDYFDS